MWALSAINSLAFPSNVNVLIILLIVLAYIEFPSRYVVVVIGVSIIIDFTGWSITISVVEKQIVFRFSHVLQFFRNDPTEVVGIEMLWVELLHREVPVWKFSLPTFLFYCFRLMFFVRIFYLNSVSTFLIKWYLLSRLTAINNSSIFHDLKKVRIRKFTSWWIVLFASPRKSKILRWISFRRRRNLYSMCYNSINCDFS